MSNCGRRDKNLRRHSFYYHIPSVFFDRMTEEQLHSLEFHSGRVDCLLTLGKLVLGPNTNLQAVCDFLNSRRLIPEDSFIPEVCLFAMQVLCKFQGWQAPEHFSVSPINSVASLMHWHPLLALLSLLSSNERGWYRSYCEGEAGEQEVQFRRV